MCAPATQKGQYLACVVAGLLLIFGASCLEPKSVARVEQKDAATADSAVARDVPAPDQGFSDSPTADNAPTDAAVAADTLASNDANATIPDRRVMDSQQPLPDIHLPDSWRPDTNRPDIASCVAIPAPEPVPEAPLPSESPAGRSQSTTPGSFHDEYLYNATDYTKIGVRQEWGGSVIYFGLASGGNVIDANDTGREVQVAFYDAARHMQNCAHNARCQSTASQCPFSITYLGWNPVQGGNRCNRGSGVDAISNENGLLSVETTPLFWNPNWDRSDCDDTACNDPARRERRSDVTVLQEARFISPHVVELAYTLTNNADVDHAAIAQELPTVYTANGNGGPDLWRLFNSSQTEIAIDTPANDGFFWKPFDSPGGWVAMQNDDLTYGVGMYYENRLTHFQGWQKRSLPFNNFRAHFEFGIPAYGQVRARAYLILGSLNTVATEAAALESSLAPFGWLDAPAAEATLSGVQTVRGWALDNLGVSSVQLWIDGQQRSSLQYGQDRSDVCKVWPGYRSCNHVGYTGSFDFSSLSSCQHLLEVVAGDTSGNSRVIARIRVTVQ